MEKKLSKIMEANQPAANSDDALKKRVQRLQVKLVQVMEKDDLIRSQLEKLERKVTLQQTSLFPISNAEQLTQLDAELAKEGNKYAPLMLNIVRPKGRVTPFRKSFPKLFSLEIMSTFNYDGDCKKSSFRAFKQINRTLFEMQNVSAKYTMAEYICDVEAAFEKFNISDETYSKLNAYYSNQKN